MNVQDTFAKWRAMLDQTPGPFVLHLWEPVGPTITVHKPSTSEFQIVDDWLAERLGPSGDRWNKAPTISMCLGGPPGVWQDYSVADPDVAFEFKMVWG